MKNSSPSFLLSTGRSRATGTNNNYKCPARSFAGARGEYRERESRTTARRHSHSRVAIAGPANVAYLFMDPGCLPGSSYQNTRPIVKGPTAVNSMVDNTYIDSSYSRTWERSDFGDVLLYSMWKNRRSSIIISMYKLPNRTAAEDVNIYRKLESSFFSRPAASLLFR